MLDNIKKASDHIIFKLLLGILIFTFAFTGIYGYIAGSSDDYVAKIGSDHYISTDAFIKAKRIQVQNIKSNYPQITDEQLKLLNINKNILQSLVLRKLVEIESKNLGILISDKIVVSEISKNKFFQNKDGKFDPMLFKALLRNSSIPENEYVENLKNEIAANFLLDIFSGNVKHSPALNSNLARYQNEKREVTIVTANSKHDYNKQNAEEIETYYKGHLSDFSTAEMRDVEYIYVQPTHFSNQVTITKQEESDATAHLEKDKNYEENKKNIVTQLKFQKIDQKIIETIQELEDEIASGENFQKLAEKFKVGFGKLTAIANKSQNIPSFKGFKKEIFKAELDQPSETLQIDEAKPGYYIINVTKITEPKPMPLDDKIKAEIIKILTQEHQDKQNFSYIKQALFDYNKSEDLGKLKNISTNIKIFDRPDNQTMAMEGQNDAIIEIFNLRPKKATKIFPSKNNSYSFMVLNNIIKPAKANDEELKKANALLNSYITMAQQNQFIEYLQEKYPVTIREDLLAKL